MWLLDSTISFLGPNAYQLRNSHSYLSDYKQEKDMYLRTQDLIMNFYTNGNVNLNHFIYV